MQPKKKGKGKPVDRLKVEQITSSSGKSLSTTGLEKKKRMIENFNWSPALSFVGLLKMFWERPS